MSSLHGANRHEVIGFPERLDDDRAEDHPVRFIAACVDDLDLGAGGCHRAVPAATGRPGDAPGDLLPRSRDGALDRLRSSRRLEPETPRQIEGRWRFKKRRPDHQTSADVRTPHLQPIGQVCRPCPCLCQRLDLVGAALVAIDGRHVRAVNAHERHVTQAKRTTLMAPSDARVAVELKALKRSDAPDDRGPVGGAHAAALAATIAALQQRPRLEEGFQAQRRSRPPAQLAWTDPERRALQRGHGRGPEVCAHVQTAVAATHTRMVACEVPNDPGDRDGRSPRARQATAGRDGHLEAVADVGDDPGPAVQACLEAGITP